jgi:hypothetical protein
MKSGTERAEVPERMRGLARTTVIAIMRQLDVADVLFHGDGDDEVQRLQECRESAEPRLLSCG